MYPIVPHQLLQAIEACRVSRVGPIHLQQKLQ